MAHPNRCPAAGEIRITTAASGQQILYLASCSCGRQFKFKGQREIPTSPEARRTFEAMVYHAGQQDRFCAACSKPILECGAWGNIYFLFCHGCGHLMRDRSALLDHEATCPHVPAEA